MGSPYAQHLDHVKLLTFQYFLDTLHTVGITVDRLKLREGRGIPAHVLPGQRYILLEYGKRLPRPILDLAVANDGLFGKLSFGGVYHFVEILWPAVILIQLRVAPPPIAVAFHVFDGPEFDGVEDPPSAPAKRFNPKVIKGGKDG